MTTLIVFLFFAYYNTSECKYTFCTKITPHSHLTGISNTTYLRKKVMMDVKTWMHRIKTVSCFSCMGPNKRSTVQMMVKFGHSSAFGVSLIHLYSSLPHGKVEQCMRRVFGSTRGKRCRGHGTNRNTCKHHRLHRHHRIARRTSGKYNLLEYSRKIVK